MWHGATTCLQLYAKRRLFRFLDRGMEYEKFRELGEISRLVIDDDTWGVWHPIRSLSDPEADGGAEAAGKAALYESIAHREEIENIVACVAQIGAP